MTERFLFVQCKRDTTSILSFTDFFVLAKKILEQIRRTSLIQMVVPKHNVTDTNHITYEKEFTNGNSLIDKSKVFANGPTVVHGLIDNRHVDLSEEQRLLYHLLCATSPTLYRMVSVEQPTLNFGKASLYQTNKMLIPTKKIWCIEFVAIQGKDRRKTFYELLEQQSVSKFKSNTILTAIQETNNESNNNNTGQIPPRSTTPPRPSITLPNPIAEKTSVQEHVLVSSPLPKSTTVEERVRDRATRQQRDEHERDKVMLCDPTGMVRDSWVQITDALWSHTRPTTRNHRIHEPTTLKRCTMPLKEAVQILAVSTAGRQVPRECRTKRQIVHILLQLSQEYPEWLSLSKGDAEDSIIYLEVAQYAAVRAKLTGTSIVPIAHPTRDRQNLGHNSILHPIHQSNHIQNNTRTISGNVNQSRIPTTTAILNGMKRKRNHSLLR